VRGRPWLSAGSSFPPHRKRRISPRYPSGFPKWGITGLGWLRRMTPERRYPPSGVMQRERRWSRRVPLSKNKMQERKPEMRPLEALLSIVNLLAFVALAAPLPPAAAWLRLVAPLALLFAGAQLLHEGSRAQMLPAYVLAGLFALVWLLQKAATGNNL